MLQFQIISLLLLLSFGTILGDVTITIGPHTDIRPISPWIYGRNNSLNQTPGDSTADTLIQLYREAGLRMLRESGGNNSTKYNWRKKLSSHPDWYNCVEEHDWGLPAAEIQERLPGAQGLFSLQLLGWAGKTGDFNFDCWAFDQCAGKNASRNYTGGVTVEEAITDPEAKGDPLTYLEPWPADSTVGILSNWFSSAPAGLGLDSTRLRYWNMDNEPEIWGSTHDDIADTSLSAEEYMQIYFSVAKKARAMFPGIKLVGPVFTNEWQWWTWKNKLVPTNVDGHDTTLCWVEFFIKRIGDEQKATGLRLLDVLDFHFYPSYNSSADVENLLQVHRIFYDTTYLWPGSNGIHMIDGKWEHSVANYVFLRARRWLDSYLGEGHGVNMGITEFGAVSGGGDASVNALNYASMLGTFGREGVEVFTPWDWQNSWWEVIHLFSRYGQPFSLPSASTLDSLVSAYPMIGKDTMTIILVNRDAAPQTVTVNLGSVEDLPSQAVTLELSDLTGGKTFISHENNAAVKGTAAISGKAVQIQMPSRSVTAVVIPGITGTSVRNIPQRRARPQIQFGHRTLSVSGVTGFELLDVRGRVLHKVNGAGSVKLQGMPGGVYIVRTSGEKMKSYKFVLSNR